MIRYSLRFLILRRKRWPRWVLVVACFGRLDWRVYGQVVDKSTCIRSRVGYVDIIMRSLGHFGVPVDAMR